MNEFLEAKKLQTTDPLALFDKWYRAYQKTDVLEPTAMNLATATKDGKPSSRMVLLKAYGKQGFVFYTNLDSRKGGEIANNPQAALNFYFMDMKRQIRIEGALQAVTEKEADDYYNSRALGSRIGAHASKQSEVLNTQEQLEQRITKYTEEFGDNPPRPKNWSGFRLVPNRIEFWQEGDFRIHNRLEFSRNNEQENWQVNNLYP